MVKASFEQFFLLLLFITAATENNRNFRIRFIAGFPDLAMVDLLFYVEKTLGGETESITANAFPIPSPLAQLVADFGEAGDKVLKFVGVMRRAAAVARLILFFFPSLEREPFPALRLRTAVASLTTFSITLTAYWNSDASFE